jgi:hypothetical protein
MVSRPSISSISNGAEIYQLQISEPKQSSASENIVASESSASLGNAQWIQSQHEIISTSVAIGTPVATKLEILDESGVSKTTPTAEAWSGGTLAVSSSQFDYLQTTVVQSVGPTERKLNPEPMQDKIGCA